MLLVRGSGLCTAWCHVGQVGFCTHPHPFSRKKRFFIAIQTVPRKMVLCPHRLAPSAACLAASLLHPIFHRNLLVALLCMWTHVGIVARSTVVQSFNRFVEIGTSRYEDGPA